MPPMINTQKPLIIVETILIMLLLLRFFTHRMDRIRPTITERIFTPAQAERTPSGRDILYKAGINVAYGKILIITAAMLYFCVFLFSMYNYLISFFPN